MTGEVQFNVVPGMTVENVQRNGSEAQAKAIVLFDANRDGVINKNEAKAFNSFDVKLDKIENGNKLSLFSKENYRPYQKREISIVYTNEDQLVGLSANSHFFGKYMDFGAAFSDFRKISYNASENTLRFEELDDGVIYRADNLSSLEIYRSDLEKLNAKNVDTIEIKETANKDLWDTSSELTLNKDTNLKVDENSKVTIKYNQK